MTATPAREWLEDLRSRDIRLWSEAGHVRFSAPTGAMTPELREELRARKAELLAVLEQTKPATIPRADRSRPLRLSFPQDRLWIVDRLTPGSSLYNVTQVWRLRGPLQIGALAGALSEIVRRHEILRTTFIEPERESAQQRIHAPSPHPLPVIELTEGIEDREGMLRKAIDEEACAGFDLGAGPLWRSKLLRFAPDDHALLLTWHHIIFDAWSSNIFANELQAFYAAFQKNQPSPLAELPVQYADFAEWQQQQLSTAAVQEQFAYWQARLSGDHDPLALPTDHPRPASQSHRGATRSRVLPMRLHAQLCELSRNEGATNFMTLLAAFKTLLVRYTGETDLWIGSPIAQRPCIETETLIGFFLNMLVLRTDAAGQPSFQEMVRRVRATVLDAFARQDVPFEKLVQALHPPRDPSHHPLFQVAFVLEPQGEFARLEGLDVASITPPVTTSKFDLTLFVKELPNGLKATFEYATDLFDASTIDRLLLSFELLLDAATSDATTPISKLPIMSVEDQRRVLVEWNDTARPYPHDQPVHDLFAQRAHETPDAIAVVDGGEHTTYRDLNVRAERVAAYLQNRGITAGDFIAIPAQRTVAFIANLIGVLKAGAAYVPFDANDTSSRVDFIKASCRMVLDVPGEVAEANPVAVQTRADAPAYVLYTSGSTGTPKGVAVPHRAITRLVVNSDYIRLEPDDAVALASNLCFDAATFEVWGALLNGGTVVMTPEEVLLSATALREHLAKTGITTLFLTTSLFNQLAQQTPSVFLGLRNLIFGGEPADAQSVNAVIQHGRPARLLNAYGPTETTTFATCHLIENRVEGRVPIGKPIANTTAYIFDESLQPVPIGVAGEIYLGGPGVALGYHGAADFTAERFLETQFGRLYRTGDRARWLASGVIDYLGRTDQQVKLRGFRIELGEIESTLRKVPGIAECKVLLRRNPGGDPLLVAYYTSPAAAPSAAELREALAHLIPAYMIPGAFILLEKFALTANGKLDLSALPVAQVNTPPPAIFAGPENTLHAQLIEIWEEVLDHRPIGISENFFHLGGHSLLAAKMLALIEERLGKHVPLNVLFGDATIQHIAEILLDEHHRTAAAQPITIVQETGGGRPFFFLHGDFIGGGLYCRNLARHIGADRPFYAVHPHGLQGSEPPSTIEEMAAERLADLRRLQRVGPYLLGGYCNGALVAYEIARQLEAAGERVYALVMLAADGSNIRYRTIKRAAWLAGALTGAKREQRQRRFLSWQRQAELGRALMKYYNNAACELWQQPEREAAKRIARKTGRVLRRLIGGGLPPPRQSNGDLNCSGAETGVSPVAMAYENAFASYVPGQYGGTITLLWPHEQPSPLVDGPTAGWSAVCRDVRLILVPGEHHSSVALDAYLRVIGEQIRTVLDEAQSSTRSFQDSSV